MEEALTNHLDELVAVLGAQFLEKLSGLPNRPLSDLAQISKGYSYSSAELVEGNANLVSLKNVGRDGSFMARGFKPLNASPKAGQFVDNGDILVAQTDLTQDRLVVGRPIRVRAGRITKPLVASLDLVIVRPGPSISREYLFAVMNTAKFRAHALAHCNGTTVVHMASSAIPSFEAPEPPAALLNDFSEKVSELRLAADQAFALAESHTVLRDAVRGLLMMGRMTMGAAK
jgi:type I restriction enzyme S subunit